MRASVLVAALVAAGCGGSSYDDDGGGGGCTVDSAIATTSVQLAPNAFIPSCIRVAPSATVTFTNGDSTTHTVTTDAGQPETFDSGILAPAATFTHTFAASPETVRIHCQLHPMRATVFVQ